MKDLIKLWVVSILFGLALVLGLGYVSGAFMSDEEYARTHPEIMERDNWSDYFENPKGVK